MKNISIEDLIEIVKDYNPEEVDIVKKTDALPLHPAKGLCPLETCLRDDCPLRIPC